MRQSTILAFIGLLLSLVSAAPVGDAASPTTGPPGGVTVAPFNIHLPRAPAPTATTAIASTSDTNVESFDIPLKQAVSLNKRNVERLFKRSYTCYDPAYYTFNTGDYWALENSWWSHTDWLHLPHLKGVTWAWGSVRICVGNYYLFADTNIYLRDLGDAMARIGNCCTGSTCAGGTTTINGDNGLSISVWVTQSARACFN
ncbi:uncharacterized protein DFL_000622 [Arthrobotrys flagrans]|uniref:Uncharacterized protein n=1 Tax=Arthrobotrys flagrans TaxID=97331 RepID=A0A437AEA6_ARTFL|nr:hypothetical protein DFL_000622 [Arthrobotrys flagrans]